MSIIESKNFVPFVVKSGNWKLRVLLEINDQERIEDYHYIEASTRAIEFFFGTEEINDLCQPINLYDDDGIDVINDDEYNEINSENDIPPPIFDVFIVSYLEDDEDNQKKWKLFSASKIFANASQPENVIQAELYEKKWEKQIKDVLKKHDNIKKNKKSKKKKIDKYKKK